MLRVFENSKTRKTINEPSANLNELKTKTKTSKNPPYPPHAHIPITCFSQNQSYEYIFSQSMKIEKTRAEVDRGL